MVMATLLWKTLVKSEEKWVAKERLLLATSSKLTFWLYLTFTIQLKWSVVMWLTVEGFIDKDADQHGMSDYDFESNGWEKF